MQQAYQNESETQSLLEKCLPIWNKLTPQQRDGLVQSTNKRSFKKGVHIHRGGTDCIGVVFVVHGSLRAYMLSESGREVTLFHIKEKESCVLSASCILTLITFEIFIDAQTNTELLVIAPNYFDSLMEENSFVDAYAYRQTAKRFSEVMWVLHQILFVSFDKRLAAFLVAESGHRDSGSLAMTHEDIAKELGSAREVVSRMLSYFQQEGLVHLSRGNVSLLDKSRLRTLAYRS